jgi:hypothetical protein
MMKLRPSAWRVGLRDTSSMMMSYIDATPQVSFNNAFMLKRVRCYSSTFMMGFVDIVLHQGAWSEKFFDKVFTGQRPPSDAAQKVRSCRRCQYFVRQIHALAQQLQTTPITWPLAMWGPGSFGALQESALGLDPPPCHDRQVH